MRPTLTAALALAGLAAAPAATLAETRPDFAENITTVARAYSVLALRSVVDFTYEAISTDPVTGEATMTGLVFYPRLENGSDGLCRVDVGRALVGGAAQGDRIDLSIEATDVALSMPCFDPGTAETLAQFGYDGLKSDMALISLSYDLPSGGTRLAVQAGVTDAVALNLTAEFEYLWVTGFLDSEEPTYSDFVPEPDGSDTTMPEDPFADTTPASSGPIPSALLSRAELSLENRGLWARVKPMVEGMTGPTDALPEMAQGMLTGILSENGGREVGAAETAFVASVSESLGRFLKDERRLTVTVAPPVPVWLTSEQMNSPGALIELLTPVVSTSAPAIAAVLPPDLLAAALTGGSLSDPDRLAAGRALMTGLGAPRDRTAAVAVLTPLAGSGNAEAAMVLAEGLEAGGADAAAYAQVLVALAGNAPGALMLADRIETRLGAEAVRDAQAAALKGWAADPGLAARTADLLAGADPSAMRAVALDARLGRNMPRNYEAAWLWASLAAAGGDRVAAHLVEGLEARAADPVWRAVFDAASAAALKLWGDGLGAALHAKTAGQ